ncbi:pirin family protein [Ornithinibacillus halotolerans]|uniref:Pirin family protein n=1 Tax=Ornithinibacillus halotolerans TaxID=1274357 RepID=A0A916W2Z9_9BACI|nr:pirin family protein [Ornithinibacillus halotolerans]GGA61822.1 hypothetical protein GCM10008025_02210 [Ornithinibacillus halotolerans]
MLYKLSAHNHKQPFKGPFTITRVQTTGNILRDKAKDTAFGSLSYIDHAVMKKGLTIKMHEHVNDEILSYVWKGKMYHRDSAGLEVPITPGNLMMMNAGSSFWHEEKVKEDYVEMLQIFVRPKSTDLEPNIQFHKKPISNSDWYWMVGPEESNAPLHVRQNIYIYDAHPKQGDTLEVPRKEGYQPFLYVLNGKITVGEEVVGKYEAITHDENKLPNVNVEENTTIVLFLVDMDASMSLTGTISGRS